MNKSKEVIFCKQLFFILGRDEKIDLLQKSNLTDREKRLCELRFVKGETTQETADELNVTLDTFNKMQKRIFQKLYLWLVLHFENQITVTRNVQMTKIDIVKMLIQKDEELSALLFCEDENISYSTFKKLLKELKPTSKLLA